MEARKKFHYFHKSLGKTIIVFTMTIFVKNRNAAVMSAIY